MSVILCTAGYDHVIRFWEALSGICNRTIQHPDSQVNRLCISPDKRYLAAAGNHNVKLYDIRSTNSQPLMVFSGHTANVTGVTFHCEGKWMVTSSEDGWVKVWHTKDGSLQRSYDHGIAVNDVVIHPNQGEVIACDRGGSVRIWDLGENKCTQQLIPEDDISVSSVSVAMDGSLLCAGTNSGMVFTWQMIQNRDITTLVPLASFQAHTAYVTRVLLSPDVHHLATCSADHNARIWSVDIEAARRLQQHQQMQQQRQQHQQMQQEHGQQNDQQQGEKPHNHQQQHQHAIGKANMNGSDPPFPQQPAFPLESSLESHQRWVWDCAFSADSAYLVTACSDHYARLWELSTSTVIRQYNGHHRGAVCVALNDFSER